MAEAEESPVIAQETPASRHMAMWRAQVTSPSWFTGGGLGASKLSGKTRTMGLGVRGCAVTISLTGSHDSVEICDLQCP